MGNSRISVLLGPTLTAAITFSTVSSKNDFFVTRAMLSRLPSCQDVLWKRVRRRWCPVHARTTHSSRRKTERTREIGAALPLKFHLRAFETFPDLIEAYRQEQINGIKDPSHSFGAVV